jgi:hypothetical protein
MKLVSLVGLLAMVACSGGGGDGDGDGDVDPLPAASAAGIRVTGNIAGTDSRPGDLNGLFIVGLGTPGLQAHGLGRSTNGQTYSLPMPVSPPMDAQNGGTTGTAFIVLTEVDDSLPIGPVDGSDQSKIIGLAADVMVVYRAAPFVTQFSWEDAFPSGWSCGQCARSPVEGAPDALNPLPSCDNVQVTMGTFGTVPSCDLFGDF